MNQFIRYVFAAAVIAGLPFLAPIAAALPIAGHIACGAGGCQAVGGGDTLVQDVRQRGGGYRGSPRFQIGGPSRGSIGGGYPGGPQYATRGGSSSYVNRGAVSRHATRGGERYVRRGDTRMALSDSRHDGRYDHRYSRRHDHKHHRRHRDRDYYFYFGGGSWLGYYDYPYGYYDYYDYGYSAYSGDGSHVQWCLNRYRSYDPESDTFMGYDGNRRRCNSPYG